MKTSIRGNHHGWSQSILIKGSSPIDHVRSLKAGVGELSERKLLESINDAILVVISLDMELVICLREVI